MKRLFALLAIVLALCVGIPIAAGPPVGMAKEGVALAVDSGSAYVVPDSIVAEVAVSPGGLRQSADYPVLALALCVFALALCVFAFAAIYYVRTTLAGLMRGAISRLTDIARVYRVSTEPRGWV